MNFKKIMAIGAATLCSTVLADVTSANIVGYNSAELQQYGLTAGTCFITISGDDVDLINLKVTGYETECKGAVKIQTLNEYGQDTATWAWQDYVNKKGQRVTGWFNGSTPLTEDEVTFQAGEGIWTYSDIDGFGFQSSGQVATGKVTVELQQFGLSVANPTPVTVDLINCVVSGYETECKGAVKVQTLNEYGQDTATWAWQDYLNKKGQRVTGWYNGSTPLTEDEVTMEPGVGLWTYCDTDGFNFEFPGVEIK